MTFRLKYKRFLAFNLPAYLYIFHAKSVLFTLRVRVYPELGTCKSARGASVRRLKLVSMTDHDHVVFLLMRGGPGKFLLRAFSETQYNRQCGCVNCNILGELFKLYLYE